MPLLNYTTSIDSAKTAAEIQAALAKAGASRIGLEYANGELTGLIFQLGDRSYRLPARFQAVYAVLKRDANVRKGLRTEQQARRVAWRILKDWVEAQLAIIETQMVSAEEVFLPYQMLNAHETLYEVYVRSDRMLPMWEDAE